MHRAILLLSFLIPVASAEAQTTPKLEGLTPTPKIEAYSTAYGTTFTVDASIQALPLEPVALFASWTGSSSMKLIATAFAGPTGELLLSAPIKPELLPEDFELTLIAAVMHDGEILL